MASGDRNRYDKREPIGSLLQRNIPTKIRRKVCRKPSV